MERRIVPHRKDFPLILLRKWRPTRNWFENEETFYFILNATSIYDFEFAMAGQHKGIFEIYLYAVLP